MVVVVVGRRIDPEGAAIDRFPLSQRDAVARGIADALEELGATEIVASAACGADLLAVEAARARGIPFRIVLPYQTDWFLEDSVTDRPGDWAAAYEQAISEAQKAGSLVILDEERQASSAYLAANERILAEGQELASEENPADPSAALAGVIVWDGRSRGPDDFTNHMRTRLEAAGAPVLFVHTLPDA